MLESTQSYDKLNKVKASFIEKVVIDNLTVEEFDVVCDICGEKFVEYDDCYSHIYNDHCSHVIRDIRVECRDWKGVI